MKRTAIFLLISLLSVFTAITGFCPVSGTRACLKIHSRHLCAPLRGIFTLNSGHIVRYAPFIWAKSPAKLDARLTDCDFQTCPGIFGEEAEIQKEESTPAESDSLGMEYEGEFSIAAYCGCKLCCGSGYKVQTYFGTQLTPGHSIAADFQLFSPGDRLQIEGTCYTVEDRARSNSSVSLLVYFDSHSEAIEFGRKTLSVYRICEEEAVVEGEPLGTFTVTGYCRCRQCTGIYSEKNMTFTGMEPVPNQTIAADPSMVPLNSKLLINGIVYTVEDTGKNITGRRLDIYFESHEEAVTYGRREEMVYLIEQPEQGGG